jgi:arylsulfatase A-like enzyme
VPVPGLAHPSGVWNTVYGIQNTNVKNCFASDFCFIYFERTDYVGHVDGWMSPAYLKALEQADMAIGHVLIGLEKAGLRDSYHFVVLSDHGGSDHHHTTTDHVVMDIPWIASGPTIRSDHVIRGAVSIVDTAPTLARILEISPHPVWEGKVVDEVFLEQTRDRSQKAEMMRPV